MSGFVITRARCEHLLLAPRLLGSAMLCAFRQARKNDSTAHRSGNCGAAPRAMPSAIHTDGLVELTALRHESDPRRAMRCGGIPFSSVPQTELLPAFRQACAIMYNGRGLPHAVPAPSRQRPHRELTEIDTLEQDLARSVAGHEVSRFKHRVDAFALG